MKHKPIKFKQYSQDKRNGEVRVVKPSKEQVDKQRWEKARQMRYIRSIKKEEF